MTTIEELEAKVAELTAERDVLSAQLSSQAEQFARWRSAVSAIADETLGGEAKPAKIAYELGAVCGK